MLHLLRPDRQAFALDPAGYAALAWTRWAMADNLAGGALDPERPPRPEDLKNPVLWLTQAKALTTAAVTLANTSPEFEDMPAVIRGVCDSQFCAVILMLVAYSLEVGLKGMIIVRDGIDAFMKSERKRQNHRLTELASFIEDLSAKDQAILAVLTHFAYWAGRYPDPGTRRHGDLEDVFQLSESHQISAQDIFNLAGRVLSHVSTLVDKL